MLFLRGGADTFNFVVPLDCDLYQEYVDVRTSIAFPPQSFNKVDVEGQACRSFGIHSSLDTVTQLYRDGHAAFVTSVGSLVEPLNRARYFKDGRICAGLWSHKHQQTAAQTSVCQISGAGPKGVGGRMADALINGPASFKASSYSVAGGHSVFSEGKTTKFEAVEMTEGPVRMKTIANWSDALHGMFDHKYNNI